MIVIFKIIESLICLSDAFIKTSDDLREAIGLHDDKLPLWIYRMRVLGYPPGWLQQAKVNTLSIFDGNGEDGELNDTTESQVQEYNKESLIEYPGFNTPVPKGVRDVLLIKLYLNLTDNSLC